jgi:cell division protein FtsL
MNRALRLEESSLRDPERIDEMARKMGLQSPAARARSFAWMPEAIWVRRSWPA